jgi:hypothetical protein
VIPLLEGGDVEVLSLDHDLGDDSRGTGYDVCTWLERKIVEEGPEGEFILPLVRIHSANPVGVNRMMASLEWSKRYFHNIAPLNPGRWEKYLDLLAKYDG